MIADWRRLIRRIFPKQRGAGNAPNFWRWLFCKKEDDKPGYSTLIDRWLILHFLVGVFLASVISGSNFVESAKNVIIPFASILTGITFAWSGNITALLTTKELDKLSELNPEGITGYVFSVQRSILIIFIALMLWALVGLGLVENFIYRFIVFSASSIAVRESWSVIMFAQLLTIYRERVAKSLKNKENGTK